MAIGAYQMSGLLVKKQIFMKPVLMLLFLVFTRSLALVTKTQHIPPAKLQYQQNATNTHMAHCAAFVKEGST